MAISNFYFHDSMRRYIYAFGTLFNDIMVQRTDDNDAVIQQLAVPLEYGPKQAWLRRLEGNPDLKKKVSTTLPRIGYEIVGFTYDGVRKLQRTVKRAGRSQEPGDNININTTFVSAPWNINMLLTIYSNNLDDSNQIIEQILPFFSPEYTVSVNVVPALDITHNIPIVLNAATPADNYEAGFTSTRIITWDLAFTMKAHFYGPVGDTGIIRRITLETHSDLTANSAYEQDVLRLQPESANVNSDYTIIREANTGNPLYVTS